MPCVYIHYYICTRLLPPLSEQCPTPRARWSGNADYSLACLQQLGVDCDFDELVNVLPRILQAWLNSCCGPSPLLGFATLSYHIGMLRSELDRIMNGWCSRFGPLVRELLSWCTSMVGSHSLELEYIAANLLLVACNSAAPDFMDGELEDYVELIGDNDAASVIFRRVIPTVAATLDAACMSIMERRMQLLDASISFVSAAAQ